MKILHVITSLRTGGAEHLLVDLLPRLRDRGYEVELLLFDGTRTPFYERLEQAGITVYSLGHGVHAMHNPFLLCRLVRFLRRHRYDIVHTHNTPCQLIAAAGSVLCSVVLVTTEHNTSNRRRGWTWYRPIDRWMYGRYERIICVSHQAEENLVKSLGSRELYARIGTIPNGVNLQAFSQARNSAAAGMSAGKAKGQYILIMVSSFGPAKDQPTLIRAMAELPDNYSLWLVGEGDSRRRQQCEELARQEGVSGRVKFLGLRHDVPRLLASADVAVMSSAWEGLPLSAVEAMASCRPVVASDVDGLREVVGGAGLLFPHKDYRRLAGTIRRLCEDGRLYAEVAQRCLRRARQYDIARMADGYGQVYRSILSKTNHI